MGADQFCSQQGIVGTMHTPLERLQIVSVGSLRRQVTSTRMVHDEYKKTPAGKMMYADQGSRDEQAIFAIASFVYRLQKFCFRYCSNRVLYRDSLFIHQRFAEQPVIEALVAFSTPKITSKL